MKPPKSMFGSWLIGGSPWAVHPANSSARMSRISRIGLRIAPAECFQAMRDQSSRPRNVAPVATASSGAARFGFSQRRGNQGAHLVAVLQEGGAGRLTLWPASGDQR
ncbi:MAG: hypothetical protein R3C16_08410 [Hyphomonadaceae bacterium]